VDPSVLDFYEGLVPDYHLLFPDWPAAVRLQGQLLDALIVAELGAGPVSILDCACGIGTQAIGLAARGHRVHATDLSPRAIERAEREAKVAGVEMTHAVANLTRLGSEVAGIFDVVIACDNVLPHFATDDDLRAVARNIRAKVRPAGLFLATIRDYDRLVAERPRLVNPRLYDSAEGQRVVYQVWDWDADGRSYRFHQFINRERAGEWSTTHRSARYRALLRRELSEVLAWAGFAAIRWRMPEETGYYQPLVMARNAGAS
jgi:glycine/sarcosine N-methyltransferase